MKIKKITFMVRFSNLGEGALNYIINPAIALMNRLPMVYKFSLISFLFLGPILVLSWLVISGLNQSVQTMNRSIDGLVELKSADRLLAAAMDYRDYKAPAILKEDPALAEKADRAASKIDALLTDWSSRAVCLTHPVPGRSRFSRCKKIGAHF